MGALLADDDPSVPLECANQLLIPQARNLAHMAISKISVFGEVARSSSTGSTYSSIASRILARASSQLISEDP